MATIPDVKVELPEILEHLHFDGVLRRGEVLVMQSDVPVRAEQLSRLKAAFDGLYEKFGVGVLFLDQGMSVAGKKKA